MVMEDNLPEPYILLTYRGYYSHNVRKTMEARNMVPIITLRQSRKLRVPVGRTLYNLRNLVERSFKRPSAAPPVTAGPPRASSTSH